jgi:hypothetical protein
MSSSLLSFNIQSRARIEELYLISKFCLKLFCVVNNTFNFNNIKRTRKKLNEVRKKVEEARGDDGRRQDGMMKVLKVEELKLLIDTYSTQMRSERVKILKFLC